MYVGLFLLFPLTFLETLIIIMKVVAREGRKEKKFVSRENCPRTFEFSVTAPLHVFLFPFVLSVFFSLFLTAPYSGAGLRDVYEPKFPKKAKRSLKDAINVVAWKYDNWLIFSVLRGGARRCSCCWQSVVVNRRSEATTARRRNREGESGAVYPSTRLAQ